MMARTPLSGLLLTWSPPHRPLAAAAEAHFAEYPENVPLAQGAPVFAGAGAALGGRHPVAVGLPRLSLLPDQGAGDRRSHSGSARARGSTALHLPWGWRSWGRGQDLGGREGRPGGTGAARGVAAVLGWVAAADPQPRRRPPGKSESGQWRDTESKKTRVWRSRCELPQTAGGGGRGSRASL